MPSTHRNRLVTAISNAPGAAGALTIAAAAAGYRTFGTADDGLSFDVSIVDGAAWEIRTGCVYTHAGTSLSRGTLEDSSTGSAIALTSAAVLTVTMSAAFGNVLERIASGYGFSTRGLTANKTLTSATFTKITGWNTEDWDIGGGFNPTTGTFTAPIAGCYEFRAATMIQKSDGSGVEDGTRVIPRIYKNGAAYAELTRVYGGAALGFLGVSGSVQINLAEADTAELYVLYSGATGTVVASLGVETTWMQCQYVGEVRA